MVPGGVDAELFSGSSASAIWSFLFSPEQRASRVRYQSKRRRAIMVIILIISIIIFISTIIISITIVIIVIKASKSIKTKIVETKFPLCTYPILAFFFTWITYLPRILEIFSFFSLTDHVLIWLQIIPFHLMKINGTVHSSTLIFHWCFFWRNSEVLCKRQQPWSTFFCPSPFVRFVWNCLPILPLKFGNCSTFSTSPNFVYLSFALMTETCSALSCIFGIPFAVCNLKSWLHVFRAEYICAPSSSEKNIGQSYTQGKCKC